MADALNRKHASSSHPGSRLEHGVSAYVNVLFYPDGAEQLIPVDVEQLSRMGVRAVAVPSVRDARGKVLYDREGCKDALERVLAERDAA